MCKAVVPITLYHVYDAPLQHTFGLCLCPLVVQAVYLL